VNTPKLTTTKLAYLLGCVGPAFAGLAFAQPPAATDPADRPGIINDPAPDSPIDRPRSDRFKKAQPAPPPEPPEPLLPPRGAGQGYIGWNLGSGYGWHASGPLEANPGLSVNSGFAPAALGHFGAEVGAQWSDTWAFAIQSRHQVIPRKATDPTLGQDTKQWAHSIMARAAYLFPREGAQFFAGAVLGGGQGFRFRVDAQPSQNLPTSDTVRGGAFVAGPVAGFILPLVEKLSLVAEARALVGLPDTAGLFELNLGIQFDLFRI
jgi:hypothetical protein